MLSCRGLYGAVGHQLLLSVVWHQRIHDDLHALSVQRPQHLSVELPGCGHHGALPNRQEVIKKKKDKKKEHFPAMQNQHDYLVKHNQPFKVGLATEVLMTVFILVVTM